MSELSVQNDERQSRKTHSKGDAVQAPMVERAFHLLDLLAFHEVGYTLSELSRQLGMSKGSMHNLLKTLERLRAIEQDEKQRYTIGPRIYDIAQEFVRHSGLRRYALPAMQRLATMSGETVFLGQLEANAARIVDFVEGSSEGITLRVTARRGMRIPLLAGAIGKAVLAGWPLARRAAYLRAHALPQFTHGSITDSDAFLAAAEEAARMGVGIDTNEEYLPGINGIAAVVHGLGNEMIAVIWIAGFNNRFAGETLQLASEALHREAEDISTALRAKTC